MTQIIDLQRRLHENGRIRIGQRVTTQTGKVRPAKLDTFRLTSQDHSLVTAAAGVWGGTPRPWRDAPDGNQWEVITEADALAVVVPPSSMAFTQAYEQWTAGGCKVRCDGRWDAVGDLACHCDPTARACDIHTRLSVILPDLPGLGVWRLDTQGYYAAVELAGVVDVCQALAESGRLLPARLRLGQRSVKRVVNGELTTLRFVVPILDVDVAPLGLVGGGPLGLPQPAEHGGEEARPRLAPVPPPPADLEAVFRPSLEEQMAAVDEDRPASSRRSAPPPATGLDPRTATEISRGTDDEAPYNPPDPEPEPELPPAARAATDNAAIMWMRATLNALGKQARYDFLDRFGGKPQELRADQIADALAWVEGLAGVDMDTVGVADSPTPEPAAPEMGDIGRLATKAFRADYDAAPRGRKTKVVDRLRHALIWATTGERTASLKDCTQAERAAVWQRLEDIAQGRMTYIVGHDGVEFAATVGGRPPLAALPIVGVAWTDIEGSG